MEASVTEDELRRWIRGELPPDARRVVSRWLVRNPHPDVARVLRGLLRDEQEARLDEVLAARDQRCARRVRAWTALFDTNNADWDAGERHLLAAAVEDPELKLLTRVGDDVVVTGALGAEVAVYLSDDDGDVQVLHAPGPATSLRIHVPPRHGRRPTVWAVWGDPLPRHPEPAMALELAYGSSVRAIRWDVEA